MSTVTSTRRNYSNSRRRLSQELQPGDWVEVLPLAEVLATLDERGECEGLPFMPEMIRFCGRHFRVFKRADKTCASAERTAVRSVEGNVVHLALLQCDGSDHGGCQARCLLFWNPQWLRPLERTEFEDKQSVSPSGIPSPEDKRFLILQTREPNDASCQRCQATRLWHATRPLPAWHLGQYIRDWQSNKLPAYQILYWLFITALVKLSQSWRKWSGRFTVTRRTPTQNLHLTPGDTVQVKSRREIMATLDRHGKNRGLFFDPEMLSFCGQTLQVTRRIECIINESTGQWIDFSQPTVSLDRVACTGRYHRFCTRTSIYYWRDIWLRRVDSSTEKEDTGHTAISAAGG